VRLLIDMFPGRKVILYTFLALVALFVTVKIVRALHPVWVKHRLERMLGKIEPWTESASYSEAGWRHLIKTARAFQKADPKLASEALENHAQKHSGDPNRLAVEQGKLFLLMRMVFEVPENAPQRIPSATWHRGQSDINPDGTFNLAWPLTFQGGNPRLLSGRQGSPGPYSARNEYSYMRYQYEPRDLSKVRVE
jgi:hypothetical protein